MDKLSIVTNKERQYILDIQTENKKSNRKIDNQTDKYCMSKKSWPIFIVSYYMGQDFFNIY